MTAIVCRIVFVYMNMCMHACIFLAVLVSCVCVWAVFVADATCVRVCVCACVCVCVCMCAGYVVGDSVHGWLELEQCVRRVHGPKHGRADTIQRRLLLRV